MATPNVGILTNAGKNLIDQVNAGQTKITFSKIVFSSMNNNQLTDDQIKALTTVAPQEIVVNNPKVTLDNNTGETRIRATGNNEALTDGVYVKTYAVYAKDDSSNEILYGITVSPNPNYLPEYDGVTPQAVTYSYKVNISNTSNITFTNSNDVYVSDTDLAEALQPYAKTVDVNQQLDKKVNVADMRKPASDVAGIEEVNSKQDKIGYTPADDSKVVHDNHDGTVQINGHNINPFNIVQNASQPYGLDFNNYISSGNYRFDNVTTINYPSMSTFNNYWQLVVFGDGNSIYQIANQIALGNHITAVRQFFAGTGWSSWMQVADYANVAHLSGANNFDTVPTVKNNPLLLASSFPSDLARTGQANTFTAAQTFSIAPTIKDASKDKGDNQAATMADLKSVENSAWHTMTGSSDFFASFTCLYKINTAEKIIELIVFGDINYQKAGTIIDLSSIISGITGVSGQFSITTGNLVIGSSVDFSGTKLTGEFNSYGTNGHGGIVCHSEIDSDMDNNPCYVYYTGLV
ncbi:hypothetical protein EFS13_08305 [Lentilactobacillus buchneri]|uniref:pyocin knob domain-containing protein n=1 Tax=Lentilactobacillus buchneri TaxID=1581 RepID=UPI0021A78345|nr:pyocin knob domain-containing protein [Lentilactobacillus buchneri]MCT3555535.1 hypothetical protein [Lentilactobacillus buchneri]